MRTRTEGELTDAAVSFIADCRVQQSTFEFATELASIGAYGAKVPKASAATWKRVIESAISSGLLIECEGCVFVPVEYKDVQLRLF